MRYGALIVAASFLLVGCGASSSSVSVGIIGPNGKPVPVSTMQATVATCSELKGSTRRTFAEYERAQAYLREPKSRTERKALALADWVCRRKGGRYKPYGWVQLKLEYPSTPLP
jgi:hypothetical protein